MMGNKPTLPAVSQFPFESFNANEWVEFCSDRKRMLAMLQKHGLLDQDIAITAEQRQNFARHFLVAERHAKVGSKWNFPQDVQAIAECYAQHYLKAFRVQWLMGQKIEAERTRLDFSLPDSHKQEESLSAWRQISQIYVAQITSEMMEKLESSEGIRAMSGKQLQALMTNPDLQLQQVGKRWDTDNETRKNYTTLPTLMVTGKIIRAVCDAGERFSHQSEGFSDNITVSPSVHDIIQTLRNKECQENSFYQAIHQMIEFYPYRTLLQIERTGNRLKGQQAGSGNER